MLQIVAGRDEVFQCFSWFAVKTPPTCLSLSPGLRGCSEECGHAGRHGAGCGDPWKDQDALIVFYL